MSNHILVIDDEPDIRELVRFGLSQEGFSVETAGTASEGLECVASRIPDLVVLDLMLPDMSGTEICRTLRSQSETAELPVVMLTARGEEVDRVVGFELGADDYVTKPFSVRELVLRVRAILRRASGGAETEGEIMRVGELRIDFDGHRVWVGDEEIVLTALEFRLLATLIKRRGRVQTRDTLLSHVWDMHGDVTTRTVDTHVRRLRKKLGDASKYIETLRGVGYRFQPEPTATAAV